MSRVGKNPISIPSGVTISYKHPKIEVKGPKGTLDLSIIDGIDLKIEQDRIQVQRKTDAKKDRSNHGLMRALIANMVSGVDQGFSKKLQVIGIGYRVIIDGSTLVLHLGYSNPVRFSIPEGVQIDVDKQNNITISGIDKQLVGQVAANIRSLRPVEPYKGKGIRYFDEIVRKKVGKTKTASA